eukprot:TRINITY_DN17010_c0_g1_i1.p1 TRINITY_DN17010_c0_g1~~TRINITY_DN17010_c0_g1_i1.p1  ORF type:complete len:133 (-),score=59.16 TRINITY_DN17010_c0_g1_i1:29-427(-)
MSEEEQQTTTERAEGGGAPNEGGTPIYDVIEFEKKLLVRVDLPGMGDSNFDLSFEEESLILVGDRVTITEVETEKGGNFIEKNRWSGAFELEIPLPCKVERRTVKASYNNGVLEVKMKKVLPENERSIKIVF